MSHAFSIHSCLLLTNNMINFSTAVFLEQSSQSCIPSILRCRIYSISWSSYLCVNQWFYSIFNWNTSVIWGCYSCIHQGNGRYVGWEQLVWKHTQGPGGGGGGGGVEPPPASILYMPLCTYCICTILQEFLHIPGFSCSMDSVVARFLCRGSAKIFSSSHCTSKDQP